MLSLLLALAVSRPPPAEPCERIRCRERPRATVGGYAFFEFAPSSGAGMGSACACTTPTGAKGEAMTFTRASSATCLKTVGTSPQLVANGDMVTCASGQPRVMPGPDGTSGNGQLAEGQRINVMLRSQEWNDPAWNTTSSGVALPIITADAATQLDNTVTAERLQVPAAGAAQYSMVRQNLICPIGQDTASFYVRGNGTASTIDFSLFDTVNHTVQCAYVSTGWTRCIFTLTVAGAAAYFEVGSLGTNIGGLGLAADVFVTDAQCEAGASASSYIATAGAAATRVAEIADLPITFGAGTTGASLAASVVAPSDIATSQSVLTGTLGDGAPGAAGGSSNYFEGQANSTPLFVAATNGAGLPTTFTGAAAPTGAHRFAIFHTGALLNNCIDGVCGAGAAGAWSAPTFTRYRIGTYSNAANYLNGVVKRVCLDQSPSRCR